MADRVLTVPNALSLLRLAGVPLFLWLLLGPRQDLLAVLLLAVSGATDWLDGRLARWLDQSSKLGAVLDPVVDRLYTLATLAAFGLRDIVPWWVVGILVGRDVVLAACLPVLRRYGYGPLEVHFSARQRPSTCSSPFHCYCLRKRPTARLVTSSARWRMPSPRGARPSTCGPQCSTWYK